ncbi:patatin-like phospholipase family protein [Thermaurantiacus sp.]
MVASFPVLSLVRTWGRLLLGFAFLSASLLHAAEAPRIGLVLGGGGAKGFAHIGVLEILEENRIPVHAIAGTSMGAVVGSLYASGRPAAELEQVAREIDWANLFVDRIPRDRLSFRRKRDERDNLVNFRIAFDDRGLVLPPGLLRGQDLYLTLAETLAPARGVRNFDDLPIPFRAVAADITNGEAVVLDRGDIATAVFASMAVPGGLPPVEREGLLLVDGGIVDNVPVDVARAMGVDIVIVVDVGSPLLKREELVTFVNVLDQLQLLLGRAAVDRQLKSLSRRDVLIRPDIDGIAMTDFTKAEPAIARGRAAALAVLDQLRPLSLSEAEWKAHLAARAARAPAKLPTLTFVRLENQSSVPDRQIQELVTSRAGQTHDPERMTRDLRHVFGLGAFRSVRYEVRAVPGLGEGIVITAKGDPSQENFFQFGLSFATDFDRQNEFGIGLAYTDRNLLSTDIEWRTDLRVGENMLMSSTLYREFGQVFAEIGPFWSRRDTLLYRSGVPVLTVRTGELGFRAEGGLLVERWGELRFGLSRSGLDLDAPPIELRDDGKLEDLGWRIQFTADRLDDIDYPTRGLYAEAQLEDHLTVLGGQLDYTRLGGRIFVPLSRGSTTLTLGGEFGTTLAGDNLILGDFRLGGLFRLSGLAVNELLGRHALLGRALVYHRLFEKGPIVDLPVYVGGSVEVGSAFNSWSRIGWRPAGSLFVSADTPLGPLTFAGGAAEGGQALYLILGRLF